MACLPDPDLSWIYPGEGCLPDPDLSWICPWEGCLPDPDFSWICPGEGCLPSPAPSREYFCQDEGKAKKRGQGRGGSTEKPCKAPIVTAISLGYRRP